MGLKSRDGGVVKSASKALEAGDVPDVVGLALEDGHGLVHGGHGDLVLHLDEELALDELDAARPEEGSWLGTPGRGRECQRQERKEDGTTHVGDEFKAKTKVMKR